MGKTGRSGFMSRQHDDTRSARVGTDKHKGRRGGEYYWTTARCCEGSPGGNRYLYGGGEKPVSDTAHLGRTLGTEGAKEGGAEIAVAAVREDDGDGTLFHALGNPQSPGDSGAAGHTDQETFFQCQLA